MIDKLCPSAAQALAEIPDGAIIAVAASAVPGCPKT